MLKKGVIVYMKQTLCLEREHRKSVGVSVHLHFFLKTVLRDIFGTVDKTKSYLIHQLCMVSVFL